MQTRSAWWVSWVVDLNALIEEALNLAYHAARARDASFNITFEREFDRGLAPTELAPQEMTQLFLNLFGNGFYSARIGSFVVGGLPLGSQRDGPRTLRKEGNTPEAKERRPRLAGVAPGFADVLAYFCFDDLLASLMGNWLRAPRQEGERSASGTKRNYLGAHGISGAEGRPAVPSAWRQQPPLTPFGI